ncbi:RHBGB protein, partial [Amia calva]|nr:RHBGB protein [Amia calva]
MAPQYAPSLRTSLPVLAILLETVFVLLFAFFVSYDVVSSRPNELFYYTYADFQDVHVMVFLGFGFLATFLVRYGFSSSGFNLLIAVMAVQWATLLNGFFFSVKNEKIHINLKSLITANLCAASALISMGCVLGKTNPVQLLLMGLIEVTGFVLNQWIIHYFLGGDQVNIIMQLCLFGACFGVTLSWSLYRPGLETRHEKERSTLVLNLFCMMGTLFLWMFWPSFNSVLTEDTTKKMNAVFSTYFSLAASTVTTFGCSVLTSKKGKINVVL